MSLKEQFIAIACIFQSFAVVAVSPSFSWDSIDPLCFYNLDKHTHTLLLNQCGLKAMSSLSKIGQNSKLIEKGYHGFDWKDERQDKVQGYSYYTYFKAKNNGYWVFTLNNAGTNAESNALFLVKKNTGDSLTVKPIKEGNRCNGGMNVSKHEGKLQLKSNLTAFSLMRLSKLHNSKLKADDDLADCAVCCFAKAVYELNENGLKLNYIDLGDVKNLQELPTQGKYQACFNRLFISEPKSHKNHMKLEELDKFVEKFNSKCQGLNSQRH